jgi:hypothetical protein
MKIKNIQRSTLSIILPLGLVFFLFSQWSTVDGNYDFENNPSIGHNTSSINELDAKGYKQKGAHVFGRYDSTNLQPIVENNIEWVTLVPYGNMKNCYSPEVVYYHGDSLDRVRRESMWKSQIDLAHTHGLKVFLKPHIWISNPAHGKWRSDIYPTNDDDWKQWQKSYREFIMLYANIAEQNDVELFCIGTELSRLSMKKSEFWEDLIRDIRSVYSGKITYAANWYKEYKKITFWKELDFIGIQAYFPLVKNEYPSVKQISKGWKKYLPALESIHEKYNRKILFTEMGYKSTADSAVEPWQWLELSSEENKQLSTETQSNCYEAFFKTVWKKEWFAGVHIWQMRSDFHKIDKSRRRLNMNFTPQGKPAAEIIAKGFE